MDKEYDYYAALKIGKQRILRVQKIGRRNQYIAVISEEYEELKKYWEEER